MLYGVICSIFEYNLLNGSVVTRVSKQNFRLFFFKKIITYIHMHKDMLDFVEGNPKATDK